MAATRACCPTVAQSNPETEVRRPHLNRSSLCCSGERHERYPDVSRRIGHRGIQWCECTDLASAIVTKQVSESYEPLILWVGQRFNGRSVFVMFHLDYLSCFLTVLATILLARKSWIGLLIAIVNSLIVCAIALRTSQLGFVPANLFCICIYAFNIRSWLKEQTHTNRDQPQRQVDSVADGLRISPAMQHRTDAATATEGAQVSNRNAENRNPISPELPNGVYMLTKTPWPAVFTTSD